MTAFDVRLLRREEVAYGTTAYCFDKPADFTFKPGQAVDLILPGVGTSAGTDARHAFSIVSAPFEPHLAVATRMRGSVFKNTLASLPLGSPAQVEGPFGSLTLHKDRTRPAVLIAGGIGVTPFISIVRQATRDRLPQRLVLLYSNRRPEDSAFLAELQRLEQENTHFRLIATMTQMRESRMPWQGETRAIDEHLLRQVAADLSTPIYYLAGPPDMVGAIRSALNRAGVDDDDMRSEEFYGY